MEGQGALVSPASFSQLQGAFNAGGPEDLRCQDGATLRLDGCSGKSGGTSAAGSSKPWDNQLDPAGFRMVFSVFVGLLSSHMLEIRGPETTCATAGFFLSYALLAIFYCLVVLLWLGTIPA